MRKCYYEVLGLERDATSDDIKKKYRRLALQWHPGTAARLHAPPHSAYVSADKNIHRQEEATRTFAEIVNAYETLADVHERAWYDSHREQILRGGDGTDADDFEGLSNLWPYFR